MKATITNITKIKGYIVLSSECEATFYDYIAITKEGDVYTELFLQPLYEVMEEIDIDTNIWTLKT